MSGHSPHRLRPFRRLYTTLPLALAALVVGWGAIWFAYAYKESPLGIVCGVLTTLLTGLALHRGRVLARRQGVRLRLALEATAARNTELERLRHLAGKLLAGTHLAELQREVADAAAELMQAEAAAVMMVVEEGRFLRIVAATGQLGGSVGMLLPADRSLVGWVVANDTALTTDNQSDDPRAHHPGGLTFEFGAAAVAPLRSAGVVVGTLSVYNRRDGSVFARSDLELLQTLGEQVVVGLDRAAMLEESRQSEQALASKNQELQRATRLKSEFLANMSHELRTPLNAIIGFSDLILAGAAGELNETQRDFLEAVLRNGRHLLALINNVLDLSKIEAGRMALSLATTPMSEVIRDVVTDTASLRSAKEQTCDVAMDDADELGVVADGGRIRQVLYNLLSNASKFTHAGGHISVSAVRTHTPLPSPSERAADSGDLRLLTRESVWISVSDGGIGIRSEDMPKLFQEFSQVDSALNRQQQGTGLGLALCKSYVELHGGTIGAESLFGRGSTFWFILPVDGPIRRSGGLVAGEAAVGVAD